MSEIIADKVNIEEELRLNGYYASVTKGISMEPLFRTHRDMVIIKAADGELKKYDVALYKTKGGRYILHRVIGVEDGVYLIRGDNTYVLERVPKESVIGVLIEFNRKGKKHSCKERGYRIYSVIWTFIYPLRVFFRFFKRVVKWPFRKIRRALRRKRNEKV